MTRLQQNTRRPCRFAPLLWLGLLAALPSPVQAKKPACHWDKIHTFHTLPSEVFAKLGLRHIAKNTRGVHHGDPLFPAGLTDIVPYDSDHLLLVRGTDNGLILFRKRVAAADAAMARWQLHVELWRVGDLTSASDEIVASQDVKDILPETPIPVSLAEDSGLHLYQLEIHPNVSGVSAPGPLTISWQFGLPLPAVTPSDIPAVPSSSDTNDAHARIAPAPVSVFIPALAWTQPISKSVVPNGTLVFEDRAADRHAAREKLGQSDTDSQTDYQLRVTVIPMPAGSVPAPPTRGSFIVEPPRL